MSEKDTAVLPKSNFMNKGLTVSSKPMTIIIIAINAVVNFALIAMLLTFFNGLLTSFDALQLISQLDFVGFYQNFSNLIWLLVGTLFVGFVSTIVLVPLFFIDNKKIKFWSITGVFVVPVVLLFIGGIFITLNVINMLQ